MHTKPLMITIPDAVKLSGMSRTAIYEALKSGDLSARKAGRRTLIAFDELEEFLTHLPTFSSEG